MIRPIRHTRDVAAPTWSVGAGGASVKATRSRGVAASRRRRSGKERVLVSLEMATGAAALIGGPLLAAAPDGSLLSADVAALEGSPFADWRLPGLLLGGLVGGGFLVAGTWQWRNGLHAREISMLAGLGLVTFEVAEVVWSGLSHWKASSRWWAPLFWPSRPPRKGAMRGYETSTEYGVPRFGGCGLAAYRVGEYGSGQTAHSSWGPPCRSWPASFGVKTWT
jgi:hypothetical protein